MKLSKKELSEMIMEALLEMIEAGDEGLIKLMRENEKLHGEVTEDLAEWVEQTKSVLQESLGMDRELITEEDDESELMTEGHIEMLRLSGVLTEGVDKDAARELELYIDNEGQLYNSQYLPILKNLSKKMAKGQYDQKLAVKLWMYLVDAGAKKYFKDIAGGTGPGKWNDMFNKATRLVVAQELEKTNREGIEDGDYL